MLWIKAFHLIAVVCWFAGIFYLPRLFVYHAQTSDEAGNARFKIMERKLYRGIMMPSMFVTVGLGVWMAAKGWEYYSTALWFQLKIVLVTLLIAYHFYCGAIRKAFEIDQNQRSHIFYRWFNEVPVLILIVITVLVIVKPF